MYVQTESSAVTSQQPSIKKNTTIEFFLRIFEMTQMKNKEQIYFVMFKLTSQMNRIKTKKKSTEKESRKCQNEDRLVAGILEASHGKAATNPPLKMEWKMKCHKKININQSRKMSEQIKSL